MRTILQSLDCDNDVGPTSSLVSKNITVNGRRTSIRLEPEMWTSLYEVARREKCSIHDLCSLIAGRKRQLSSLTASIRVFLMLYYKAASTEEGHVRSGHGNFEKMRARANGQRQPVAPQVEERVEQQRLDQRPIYHMNGHA
jgi:predicted DNA-binding ribbon-helix-helix protein